MTKNKFDPWIQLRDRVDIILEVFGNEVVMNPLVKSHKKLRKQALKISESLDNFYREVSIATIKE